MTAPRTLRRKLQKKSKRRRFARCCLCGGFAAKRHDGAVVLKRCREPRCGWVEEQPWTGRPG